MTGEETFTSRLQWEKSDSLYRISSGREYQTAVPITEDQAMAHVEKITRIVKERESNKGE
jgi:hypothetical protein